MTGPADEYRILIVDDEENLRDGSERVLSRSGFTVSQATEGKEALATLSRRPHDLVLLDLNMPGLSGIEVLERIREGHPDTLVIIITGFATIETAIEAMKKGAYDFMTKPFRPDQLRLVVGRAVEHIQLREKLERLSAEREAGLWAITTEKSRLRTVMDSIIAGLLIMEQDKRIVMCNPAFSRMMRVNAQSITGTNLSTQPALKPIDDIINEILAGPSVEKGGLTREFVIPGPSPTYLRATVNEVVSETGKLLGLVAVVRDFTLAKEQEKEKMAFVAMLTHELRSPLGAVDTQLHVILKGLAGDLNEKLANMLTRVRARLNNIQLMINDLLDLSKIEAHQFAQEKAETDLNPLVEDSVDMLRPQAEAKGQELEVNLASNLPPIMADSSTLKEVSDNLISNAIRYTPPGGRIRIITSDQGEFVEFLVADNGPGISDEYHEKIFHRFFRVKDEATRHIVGTGLGLPIVKAIVEDLLGTVTVDSEPGRGSTFRVRLPAVR